VLTEKDGKLYGRGSTDDKGPVLGWIHAIESYQALGMQVPVNLKVNMPPFYFRSPY
jgi:cytosolic nonspecific dipeptidase